MTKILVTSALPYANGPIHIGHLVEYIQTDIFVRFLRSIGEDVIYCCADDTHGTPIEIASQKEGIIPEELIGKYHKEHLRDFTNFHIKFDSYYSTNSSENKQFSDLIFTKAKEKGLIYQKDVELTFCEKCKRFLPDRYIKGKCPNPQCGAEDQYGDVCEFCNTAYKTTDLINPYCTICGKPPVRKISKHYFFKLSSVSDKLKKWLNGNKRLQPEIKNYVLNWIKGGLQDWDISRDGPYFGFKIPGEENLYYYVWLDAPIGYIASNQNYCKENKCDALKDYWQSDKSEIIHFIGKDITYFHFLFWPAMLMAADLKVPDNIVVHGFLTVNGAKMSKSRGTFFTAEEFASKYNPEYLRFYYSKVLSKKMADIDLDFNDFKDTANNEIVGNLGNFCYRVLSFLNKFFDSKVGGVEEDNELIGKINKKIEKVRDAYLNCNSNEAVKEIMAISDLGNRYFQNNEPWKLVKTDKEKAHKVLGLCANIVKNLSILIEPVLPKFSAGIQKQLGVNELGWKYLGYGFANSKIKPAKIIINKLEEVEKKTFPLDLRVGKVVSVKEHPEADKLYILEVDLDREKRQLVAGLREYYKKEELTGKKVVVVCNLKQAKLRGVVSQGMLLAAEKGKEVKILEADKSALGSAAVFEGLESSSTEITIDQFSKIKLKIKDKKVVYDKLVLRTDKEEIKADIGNGAVVG
ncbi:methionine--tRNA ligase [Candidatus Woesearchaeota archaeon]|nr:methionine--tRNA ligase [Candidatus Woesearchaeota archaeon]